MRVTASQIRLIISRAGFTLNGYAAAYVDALDRAEREYGEKGVKTQILYILNNMRAKGAEQVQAKKNLARIAKYGNKENAK